MTKSEAVLRAQELIGCEYERSRLTSFIDELDMRAKIDIFNINTPDKTSDNQELAIPAPYDMAYVQYAVAKVNFEREEFSLYNNYYDKAMNLFSAFARLHNRNKSHSAKKVKGLW